MFAVQAITINIMFFIIFNFLLITTVIVFFNLYTFDANLFDFINSIQLLLLKFAFSSKFLFYFIVNYTIFKSRERREAAAKQKKAK